MNIKEYKARCSSLGVLTDTTKLTDAQIKTLDDFSKKEKLTDKQKDEQKRLINIRDNPKLTQGAKTKLKEWYVYKKFRDKDYPFLKEAVKGNLMEDESIYLVDRVLFGGVGLYKNSERKEDELIEGECDVEFDDVVIDVKSCWDSKTFYGKLEEGLTRDYVWQLKGYARLYNKSRAILAYTLVNTPTYACLQACHRGVKMDEITFDVDYSHIPENERVIAYEVNLEDSDDKIIEDGVVKCREFLEEYTKGLENKFGIIHK
jgi:hypothetical protein